MMWERMPLLFVLLETITCNGVFSVIINTSLVTGDSPSFSKHGTMTPVNNINNYRPVTILLMLSKVLEKKIVTDHLTYMVSDASCLQKQHYRSQTKFMRI